MNTAELLLTGGWTTINEINISLYFNIQFHFPSIILSMYVAVSLTSWFGAARLLKLKINFDFEPEII